jgi:formylglycine-generating enzyme required for sulfatase activity
VKAGLLPRLADHVIPVYVEATAAETETRLRNGLRKRFPGLPADVGLVEALTSLRRKVIPARQQLPETSTKVLLVLDQFEQWLHARRQEPNAELVEALRQCDGQRVQALVLVRDDFGMAVTRFMHELEIPILEGQNFAAVDLFDPRHARKVLAKFGRSFGALPANPAKTTLEQERFLDEAVAGLGQDGKVIPVRLALFAEMVKTKPWTPATLKQVGGTEGLGLAFLEEMFGARSANPEHHVHQRAVRAVLQALLPEHGTDLKGHMRSHEELLQASGYARRPSDFDDVIRILDKELRLVTPTDPQGVESEEDSPSFAVSGNRYYQLTHDYLVPALRQWLTRKQRETWRGRAALRLAERAALWSARPEARQLPSWWEWWNIELFTRKAKWTVPERKMMRSATRHHSFRAVVVASLLILAMFGALELKNKAFELQDSYDADSANLVQRLIDADISQAPRIIADMQGYSRWTKPKLLAIVQDPQRTEKARLHARMALLPMDQSQLDYLYERCLGAGLPEFLILRDFLQQYQHDFILQLWRLLQDPGSSKERRFRAGLALAKYGVDPSGQIDVRLKETAKFLTDQLLLDIVANREAYGPLTEALRSMRSLLVGPLVDIFRNTNRSEIERELTANILANYASDQPVILTELIKDAESWQGLILMPALKQQRESIIPLLEQELSKIPSSEEPNLDNNVLIKRQSNAAVTLVQLDKAESIWPLLQQHADAPALRTYLIHGLATLRTNPTAIIRRLENEEDASAVRALILCLGEFGDNALSAQERRLTTPRMMQIYRKHGDSGVHSAVDWLLRRWKQSGELDKVEEELVAKEAANGHDWYRNQNGDTMAVIHPGKFTMGSPETEPYRAETETPHATQIRRKFAIATKEVTLRQFKKFLDVNPTVSQGCLNFSREEEGPVIGVTWFEAVQYCRWLSKREGIKESEMPYPPVEQMAKGMSLPDDYLKRTGYRLPTESEWEYSCRAGATTSWFFGASDEMLGKYAWYLANSNNRIWPVGLLKPNDFGLFDMYGNAAEWTHDRALPWDGKPVVDEEEKSPVVRIEEPRIFRGGAFVHPAPYLRSAARFIGNPNSRDTFVGFRVARTIHDPKDRTDK